MTNAIFFIFGMMMGSFLNVLAIRLHTAEEIFLARSKCPHCKKIIRWYDNIPVLSFLLLRFRCRDCHRPISWSYPAVEIFTGTVFALVSVYFFETSNLETWVLTAFYLFVVSALVAIFIYDWLYMEIPTLILWPAIFVVIFFNLYFDTRSFLFFNETLNLFESRVFSGNLAAILAFSAFFSLSFFSREKWMGMGDVYLVILLGLFLGWPKIILGLFLAFLLGSIYGIIIIIIKKKKKLKSQVPFAPFLVTGSLVALFFYQEIITWYLSIFL